MWYRVVGEYGDSKRVTTQVQFRAGQTEALLTMNMVREQGISSSAPALCQVIADTLPMDCLEKKEVKNNNHFTLNKARCPTLGGMD